MKHLNWILAVVVVGIFAWSVWAAGQTFVKVNALPVTTSSQTAWSSSNYTFGITNEADRYRSYVGDFIIRGPIGASAATGVHGAQCSAYVMVKTVKGLRTMTLDSNRFAGIPCTLHVSRMPGDTLLGSELFVTGRVLDSLGDTVATLNFEMVHNLTMKE